MRRSEVVSSICRASALVEVGSALRKGKREKKWLSLDPLVARLLRTRLTKRGR